MDKNDISVGTGLVGAPACGDVMKLQIQVDPNDQTIKDVKFKTFGCGSAIASSSYLTELVRGMTLEQAGRIRNTEIAKELSLPPVKCEYSLFLGDGEKRMGFSEIGYVGNMSSQVDTVHCSMLAEDAIKSAISNYYTKNPNARKTDLGGTSVKMPEIQIEQVPTTGATAAA